VTSTQISDVKPFGSFRHLTTTPIAGLWWDPLTCHAPSASPSAVLLIYNLTFHLRVAGHFNALQLHFMTDKTDLLKALSHAHTHTHRESTATPISSLLGFFYPNRIINLMGLTFFHLMLDRNFNRLAN